MPAAVYARVSREEEQQNPHSADNQIAFLREWAHQLGYSDAEVLEYKDRNESGSTLRRPGLERLRKDASGRKFERVLFYKLDRLSRNIDHIRMLVFHEFKDLGITPMFKDLPDIDFHTANGEMVFNTLANLAQWQRRYTSEVTSFHLRQLKKAGYQIGRPPYGYRKKSDKKEDRGVWVIDEHEAEVIREVERLHGQELSFSAIARELNQRGMLARSGKKWYPKTIREIVIRNRPASGQETQRTEAPVSEASACMKNPTAAAEG